MVDDASVRQDAMSVSSSLRSYAAEYVPQIDAALRSRIMEELGPHDLFAAPLEQLLSTRGKRLRPLLTLLSCELCGTDPTVALDHACAIECFHTSSLILDDLPCMDDAELRRGNATLHRQFGAPTALLTALVLFNLGHRLLGSSEPAHQRIAQLLGAHGMIGGQAIDLGLAHAATAREQLESLRLRKTSALFAASMLAGGYAAAASARQLDRLADFGVAFGELYQLADDRVDAYHDGAAARPVAAAHYDSLSFQLRTAGDRLADEFPNAVRPLLVLHGLVAWVCDGCNPVAASFPALRSEVCLP